MVSNMIDELNIDSQALDNRALIFKVLTHPTRIAILELLRDSEQCVCHMETYLGFRQAYISQQLMVLKDAGLIKDRRDGWNVYYSVKNPQIFEVLDSVGKFIGDVPVNSKKLGVVCPCPKCCSKS